MKLLPLLALLLVVTLQGAPADTARSFLAALYGDDSVDLTRVCHPHPDLWMLPGPRHEAGLAAVATEKISVGETGTFTSLINQDLCIVELRDGKVDASYNLETVYGIHRRVVLQFLYFSLQQDRDQLATVTTDPGNLGFGRYRPAPDGDMDVYGELISIMPVVRESDPAKDATTRTITYRVPLGKDGFRVTLRKIGQAWKIDTAKRITVPLEFFYR